MGDCPQWQTSYQSMNSAQLVEELERLARFPHRYDNHIERKTFIAAELTHLPAPTMPIIVMEVE